MKQITFFLLFITINVYSQQFMFHAQNKNCPDLAPGCGRPFTDARDGKVYNTVQIGCQCWMAENLNYGTQVNRVNGWYPQTPGTKFCTDISLTDDPTCTNGGLYDWGNLMDGSTGCNGTGPPPLDKCATPVQGLCAAGWHVPSHYEVTTLERNMGSNPSAFPYDETTEGDLGTDEGGNLREVGTANWRTPNVGATNLKGFNLLPAGYADNNRYFNVDSRFHLRTSSDVDATTVWRRTIIFDRATSFRFMGNKNLAYPVRCIRDN